MTNFLCFHLEGTPHNKRKSDRSHNVIHDELTFERESDGMFVFKSPAPIQIEQWEGLSGSPFFSENGELIGMIIRAVEQNDTVFVLPISKIMSYIKLVKKIEDGCS